jgi:toxin ParE1/3/4
MPCITQREAARRDLVEHFVYLADEAGLDTAERFLRNAEASFSLLATQPNMGAPLSLRRPELAGLRKWRVGQFRDELQKGQTAGNVLAHGDRRGFFVARDDGVDNFLMPGE